MLNKADKRKRHEAKDTEFTVGNRALTMDRVYQTVKRSKNVQHGVIAEGMWLSPGVRYPLKRGRRTNSFWSHIQHPP